MDDYVCCNLYEALEKFKNKAVSIKVCTSM